MSQEAFLKNFDALAVGAFVDVGIGDRARYYAPSSSAGIDCSVLVDRASNEFGDERAPLAVPNVTISFQLSEVRPIAGGRVVLINDDGAEGEAWRLDALTDASDESMSIWQVAAHG